MHLYIKKTTNKLVVGCKNIKIPSNITSIEDNAFEEAGGQIVIVV